MREVVENFHPGFFLLGAVLAYYLVKGWLYHQTYRNWKWWQRK